MTKSSVEELVSMGYTKAQATQALKVAGGDLEQAVGFLCLGEASQSGFNHSFNVTNAEDLDQKPPARLKDPPPSSVAPAPAPPVAAAVSSSPPNSRAVQDLVAMGYEENRARQALHVAHGDMDQAVSFLLMGESRLNFITEESVEDGGIKPMQKIDSGGSSDDNADDAALAARLQQEEIDQRASAAFQQQDNMNGTGPVDRKPPGSCEAAESEQYHATTMNNQKDAPKMVATESRLMTPGAAPYCACVAAARFLTGGVVTSAFLNSILGGGVELYRKGDEDGSPNLNVSEVLDRYGRSHLGIVSGNEPKGGFYVDNDLKHETGIRRLLTDCRNEQREGWSVIIMELEMDSFLICLPPKGSKNKFWYIDFSPRTQFRVPGAYARVHSTLLQMQESIESIFHTLIKNRGTDIESFTLYKIQRLGS